MKPKREHVSPLVYIVIAAILMVLVKTYIFDGRTPFQDVIYDSLHDVSEAEKGAIEKGTSEAEEKFVELTDSKDRGEGTQKLYDDIEKGFLDLDVPMPEREVIYNLTPKHSKNVIEDEQASIEPSHTSVILPSSDKVRVAIVIDDMGESRHYSLKMMELDRGVTLSFLPTAPKLEEITADALKKGFELMMHVPMEAVDRSLDLGSMALRDSMDERAFKKALHDILDSFDGYVGVNNHMGSLLTQDEEKMGWVMDVITERADELYFLDSKTIHDSVAAKVARNAGLNFAERHVFLDHEDDPDAIRMRLNLLEESARHRGYAIAIGHPRKLTYEALVEWIPTLQAKGIELVPVSELLMRPVNFDPSLLDSLTSQSHPAQP